MTRRSGRQKSDMFAVGQFFRDANKATTQFGTLIADGTTSLLDLPSSYPFNSERYELVQEGTVGDTEFSDTPGEFLLSVNGTEGDKHRLKARQRLTYLPNYELLWGAAYYMDEQLEPGQRLTIALSDPADENGYYVEIESDAKRCFIRNGGTDIDVRTWGAQPQHTDPYNDAVDETQPQVLRQFVSWYGDGAAKTTLTHAGADSIPQNTPLATVANRGEVATEEINLNISVTLECTGSTTANTVHVLSYGALNRGAGSTSNRVKSAHNWSLGGDINSTSFTPVLAIRRIPDKAQIPTQLSNFEIIPEDTMEVVAIAFAEGSTDASDWDVPPQKDPENTAVEQTTSISTIPTDANDEPDGRLIDLVIADAQGNRSEAAEADVQAEFYEDEVVVFVARTKTASNSSVDLTYRTRQEW